MKKSIAILALIGVLFGCSVETEPQPQPYEKRGPVENQDELTAQVTWDAMLSAAQRRGICDGIALGVPDSYIVDILTSPPDPLDYGLAMAMVDVIHKECG